MFDGNDTVLVIGAHPDDEVLGAGGTIAKHASAGDEVHVLIITEGVTQQYENEQLIGKKKSETRKCCERHGVDRVYFEEFPDMRLDEVGHVELNAVIEKVCDKIRPDIVYTHSRREVNRDHIEIYDSVLVATRPSSNISTVLAYETPSSTNFTPVQTGFEPDLFIDIEDYIDRKIQAFEAYETEVREYPHPRSAEALKALAKTRGSASNCHTAEAFDILRMYR